MISHLLVQLDEKLWQLSVLSMCFTVFLIVSLLLYEFSELDIPHF